MVFMKKKKSKYLKEVIFLSVIAFLTINQPVVFADTSSLKDSTATFAVPANNIQNIMNGDKNLSNTANSVSEEKNKIIKINGQNDQANKKAETLIRASLHSTTIDSITPTPISGLYQVIAGKNVFYSDAIGEYLFFGHLYDLKTQTDLTALVQKDFDASYNKHVFWSDLPKHAAIVQNPGKGEKIAIFTDPECPYSKSIESELSKVKDIEIDYYLYPLTSLHPTSKELSEKIWCSQDPLQALYGSVKNDDLLDKKLSRKNKKSCDLKALENISSFAQKNHFNGTPILIREDGAVAFGYRSLLDIQAWVHEPMTSKKLTEKLTTKLADTSTLTKK